MRTAHAALGLLGLLQAAAALTLHGVLTPDWSSAGHAVAFRSAAVARHGQLAVRDGALVDAAGAPVLLRGVSLHQPRWFPPTPGWTVPSAVRAFRVDLVRIALTPGDAGAAQARAFIRDAADAGVYAVVGLGEPGDGARSMEREAAIFSALAAEHGHHPNLIYELSGPSPKADWPETRAYAEVALAAIRAHDPDGLVIVNAPRDGAAVQRAAADPLEDSGVLYGLQLSGDQELPTALARLDRAQQLGAPVIVTSWQSTRDGASELTLAGDWLDALEARGVSWVRWSLSNKDEPSSLLTPEAPLSGPWEEAELTRDGRWLRDRLAAPPNAAEVTPMLAERRPGELAVLYRDGHPLYNAIEVFGGQTTAAPAEPGGGGPLVAQLDLSESSGVMLSLGDGATVDLRPYLDRGGLSFRAKGARGDEHIYVGLVDEDGVQTQLLLRSWRLLGTDWTDYELPLKVFPQRGVRWLAEIGLGSPEAFSWERVSQARFFSHPSRERSQRGASRLELDDVVFVEAVDWEDPELRWGAFASDAPDRTLHDLRTAVGQAADQDLGADPGTGWQPAEPGSDGMLLVDFVARQWAPLERRYPEGDERRDWSGHYGLALDLYAAELYQRYQVALLDAGGERWTANVGIGQGHTTTLVPFRAFKKAPTGHLPGAEEDRRLDLEDVRSLQLGPGPFNTVFLGVSAIRLSNAREQSLEAVGSEQWVQVTGSLEGEGEPISPQLPGINAGAWDDDLLDPEATRRVARVGHGLVRFPGGLTGDEYHWEEELAAAAPDRVDTDEFLGWCDEVGATPIFIANFGTGTPEEAARWVEHVDGRVPYWEIGNEIYGYWHPEQTSAEEYGRRARAYIEAMKAVDPDIQIAVVGEMGDPEWNRVVLDATGDIADAIALHYYAQNPGEEDDRLLLATPQKMPDFVTDFRRQLEAHPVSLGRQAVWMTEWNSVPLDPGPQTLEMGQGLWVADYLGALAEAGVPLASYWSIHNSMTPRGGDYGYLSRSFDPAGGQLPRPAYHAFRMAADALRGALYPSDSGRLELTSYLTRGEGGPALLLINKDPTITFNAALEIPGFSGEARVEVLEERLAALGPGAERRTLAEGELLSLPPYSITLIRLAAAPPAP
jgi:hypothetical protein